MTKSRFFRQTLLLASLLTAAPLVVATPVSQAETAALTSPPPVIVTPYTTYTGYTYLYSSTVNITDNGNQTVTVAVTTQTKSTVSEVGATIQLQRYTGSAWVDSGSATTLKTTNSSSYSGSVTLSAVSGYYFRAAVTHYAKQGSTTESVVDYSSSMLVS